MILLLVSVPFTRKIPCTRKLPWSNAAFIMCMSLLSLYQLLIDFYPGSHRKKCVDQEAALEGQVFKVFDEKFVTGEGARPRDLGL